MKRKPMSKDRAKALHSFVFLCPWIIGFVAFFAVPLFNTVLYSFNDMGVGADGTMEMQFVGLKNYIALFTTELSTANDQIVRMLVEENARIFVNAPVILVLSLFLAIILNMDFKGRGAVRLVFFLPIILGLDIVIDMLTATGGDFVDAAADSFFGEESGVLMFLKENTFLPEPIVDFVGSINENIYTVISSCGVQTLIFLAGLQSISGSLYEVAKIEGANQYEIFWKITLPMLKDILVFVLTYSFIDLFLSSTIATEIYNFAFLKNNIGVGSALSFVYMLNVLIDLVVMLFLFNKVVNVTSER